VPAFGDTDVPLLIVGLAPGLKGANRTGRPFAGDYAGHLLYNTLIRFGLAEGRYSGENDNLIKLRGCRITNAVRCVPPHNKPTSREIATCAPFLASEILALQSLQVILALGRVAHGAVLTAVGQSSEKLKFGHGAIHPLTKKVMLVDSYHCSRQNTNTGRLTQEMFNYVFEKIENILKKLINH
jgi:uracil-DNA glycosylase family 4